DIVKFRRNLGLFLRRRRLAGARRNTGLPLRRRGWGRARHNMNLSHAGSHRIPGHFEHLGLIFLLFLRFHFVGVGSRVGTGGVRNGGNEPERPAHRLGGYFGLLVRNFRRRLPAENGTVGIFHRVDRRGGTSGGVGFRWWGGGLGLRGRR